MAIFNSFLYVYQRVTATDLAAKALGDGEVHLRIGSSCDVLRTSEVEEGLLGMQRQRHLRRSRRCGTGPCLKSLKGSLYHWISSSNVGNIDEYSIHIIYIYIEYYRIIYRTQIK